MKKSLPNPPNEMARGWPWWLGAKRRDKDTVIDVGPSSEHRWCRQKHYERRSARSSSRNDRPSKHPAPSRPLAGIPPAEPMRTATPPATHPRLASISSLRTDPIRARSAPSGRHFWASTRSSAAASHCVAATEPAWLRKNIPWCRVVFVVSWRRLYPRHPGRWVVARFYQPWRGGMRDLCERGGRVPGCDPLLFIYRFSPFSLSTSTASIYSLSVHIRGLCVRESQAGSGESPACLREMSHDTERL